MTNRTLAIVLTLAGGLAAALAGPGSPVQAGNDRPMARGGEAVAGVLITGEADALGVKGPFSLLLAADGRFRQDLGGPLPQVLGWDGATAWDRDWNGTSRPLHLRERDEGVLDGLILSGAWADGADDGGRIAWGEPVAGPTGGSEQPFTMGERGLHGTLTVDAEGQLVGYACGTGTKLRATTLKNHRDFAGTTWPTVITQTTPSGEEIVLTTTGVEAVSDPAALADLLAADIGLPADHRFLPDLSADVEIFEAPTGHLLVHPLLDGQDVGWFIFDTGAGALCLDNAVADSLGYTGFGEITAKGVGGFVAAKKGPVQWLELGGQRFEQVPAAYALADEGAFADAYTDGNIGNALLKRFRLVFDYGGMRMALVPRAEP